MSLRLGIGASEGRGSRGEDASTSVAARLDSSGGGGSSVFHHHHHNDHRSSAAAKSRRITAPYFDSMATPGPNPLSTSLTPETARPSASAPFPDKPRHSDSPPSAAALAGTSTRSSGTRRHVVFPDPVAFRYLEEDPSVTAVERRTVLRGYELYLVEQWACSRRSPTLVIVTYTGDVRHRVMVGVMGIPADECEWSPRLRMYFKAIQQYHARPKDTHLGELMVTNLSSFPSALTVIPVPDGDIRLHRHIFIVNEDLKRMGCSGRSGMTLSEPTPATQAKFLQLYRTSDRINICDAVVELVKLCQVALLIFGRLEHEYVDGLLCDVTEAAINDWWTEIGSDLFNAEPSDGILGPTTVAALLGTLMGARNRLSWYGAPVPKDVFDVDGTKRGIGHFQKAYKLERTRRLDRQTLLGLHKATAKAAAGEGGWTVQKAVKSTVAEIGGKRGEMVIGMVGGKDKGNIADIETLDIDRLIDLAYGERPKWLWHGKAKRSSAAAGAAASVGSASAGGGGTSVADYADRGAAMPDMGGLLFGGSGRDEPPPGLANGTPTNSGTSSGMGLGSQRPLGAAATATTANGGNAGRNSRRVRTLPSVSNPGTGSAEDLSPPRLELRTKNESATMPSTQPAPVSTAGPNSVPLPFSTAASLANILSESPAPMPAEKGDVLRKTVFKRVGGKVNDARSGLGRIVDGGRRALGHNSRPSKDEGGSAMDLGAAGYTSPSIASLAQSAASLSSPVGVGRAFTWKNKPDEYANAFARAREAERQSIIASPRMQKHSLSKLSEPSSSQDQDVTMYSFSVPPGAATPGPPSEGALIHDGAASESVAGSIAEENAELQAEMLAAFGRADDAAPPAVLWLQRRHSVSGPAASTRAAENGGGTSTQTSLVDEARWPRRLSFSIAEEAVLRWGEVLDVFEDVTLDGKEPQGEGEDGAVTSGAANEACLVLDNLMEPDGGCGRLANGAGGAAKPRSTTGSLARVRIAPDKGSAEAARALFAHVSSLRSALEPWVAARVGAVEALDDELGRQVDELSALCEQLADAHEAVRRRGAELLGDERARLSEAVRDVEVLGARLEYEIGALASRVADVEDGVDEFERQVGEAEARADELKVQLETESWMHWAVRTVTGIGTGPNITGGGR